MVLTMTPDELGQAIAWFSARELTMPGARKMYDLAACALKSLQVYQDKLDDLDREELIGVIHYLRAVNINRGRLIDRLEDEVYRLKGGAPE